MFQLSVAGKMTVRAIQGVYARASRRVSAAGIVQESNISRDFGDAVHHLSIAYSLEHLTAGKRSAEVVQRVRLASVSAPGFRRLVVGEGRRVEQDDLKNVAKRCEQVHLCELLRHAKFIEGGQHGLSRFAGRRLKVSVASLSVYRVLDGGGNHKVRHVPERQI